MADSDLKALSREWFEQVWNRGDERTIDRLIHESCPIEGLADDGGPLRGPGGFKVFWRKFRAAFPDVHVDVTDVVVDGDKAVSRIVMTATHGGPGLGIEPTHRKIRMTALCLAQWRDGQIVTASNEMDAAGLQRQLTQ